MLIIARAGANMSSFPQPLFETYSRFHELSFLDFSREIPSVRNYLESFSAGTEAVRGYCAIRGFLRSYGGNEATFNSYRTHVERLLLWSLIVAQKPILNLRRSDAEQFMEFCLDPLPSWIGKMVKSRFVQGPKSCVSGMSETFPNPQWKPFSRTGSKRDRSLKVVEPTERRYEMSQGSVAQVFAVCGSFFQYAIDEGLTEVNPFRAVRQKSIYKQRNTHEVSGRSLTHLQWEYIIETTEAMADEDPRHERSLFILTTLFSMYLRVSDLVGRDNWKPTMGDFRKDTLGNWWFHVIGKGNKAAKISVREEYICRYMARYRKFLGLTPLPSPNETHPLLLTLGGRRGLSDRHIRQILQKIFDLALENMKADGREEDEIDNLRSASLHWLRHTSATFDAPYRDMKDLQADLRHNSLATTQNTYYNSLDEQRAHSARNLKVR